jgi:branched-chain amino acid transport system permease protein
MRRAEVAGAAAYVAGVLLIARFADEFWLFLLTSALITALVAVSVGVIYDNAGLLSLCQMTFAGIGAWTVGWLSHRTDLPFLAQLPLAALVALGVGVLVGIPALRLRGLNLAVFTLVFSAAVSRVIFADGFPGLLEGNRVRPPGFADGEAGFFLLVAVALGLVAVAVAWLRRVRLGRWWFSVRRSERAVAALGRSVVRTKLSAFAASAAIAGLAGGMLVALNGVVSGASFEPLESMTILTAALMFGAGHFEGALLAGLFGRLIPNFLSDLGLPQDIAPMIFAAGGLVALSQGEGGLSAALRAGLRHLRSPAATPDPARPESGVEDRTGRPQPLPAAAPVDAPMAGNPVLALNGISVSYGAVKALDDVSLEVAPGTILGLIGPNGAGKSTLVDTVTGFLSPRDGTVTLAGEDIGGLAPRRRARRGVRRSFQQSHVPVDLTVGGYLDLAARYSDLPLGEALTHFGLPPVTVPVRSLDVGTRRILEVCGTIVSQPRVVLLDEPAAGLSGHVREQFVDALAAIPASFGCSVLLIEHDLNVVASTCDRVVVLNFGRAIADGPPEEVLSHPAVVAAYLGASNGGAGPS